jgi:small conductance mechanosensitive channel
MELFVSKLGTLVEELYRWAPKLMGAVITLILGLWIINMIATYIRKAFERSGLDKDVVPFLSSLVTVLLKIMLVISIAGMLGIETTSFIALLGMAGVAIGAALQGTLGNFASGVMIMIFKPYRVGDIIELQSVAGKVEEIHIFNTVLKTPENKKVVIPNGIATSGIITNNSANKYLRVDLQVAMTYEDDFEKVKAIIIQALQSTPNVLSDPAPVVEILKFNDQNILLAVRPFAATEDYWQVYSSSYQNVKKALADAQVKVAYPKANMILSNSDTTS